MRKYSQIYSNKHADPSRKFWEIAHTIQGSATGRLGLRKRPPREGAAFWEKVIHVICRLIARVTEMHAHYYGKVADFGREFACSVASSMAEFIGRLDNPSNEIWTIKF